MDEKQSILHNSKIRSDLMDGTLNGYQQAATLTAIYPGQGLFWGLVYVILKGAGEAGEQAEKVGKLMRDDGWQPFDALSKMDDQFRLKLAFEIGDELWYIAAKAKELGFTLQKIAELNIAKLEDRQLRGTLSGSGDTR